MAAFIALQTGSTKAGPSEFWISVDSSELQHILSNRGSKKRSSLSDVGVEQVVGDLAILKLTDEQMEDLSRAMHDNFHKCSGYVAHTDENEALIWARDQYAARTESQFVNYTIDNPIAVNSMLNYVNEPHLRQTIIDLSAFPNRRYNQASGLQSANWIKDKWSLLAARQSRGQISIEFFNHPTATSPQPSIIMTIWGTRFPDEIIVLGAHQDSINSSGQTASAPGADDDASGIATLTETIRVMMETGFKPERTVQFMAYAAEEVGLRGSNAIATSYRNANKNVLGVMQLDMTNYRGTQGYDMVMITDNTNAAQNQFLRDLLTTYQPGLTIGNSSCGYACSDHASWHNKSYPASFPFEAPLGNDNSAIHTANDTIARSNNNANHAVRFSKLALSYIGELAKGCVAIATRC
ncbi:MAG: M20/M25/M40 family metallo-hydrolase [Acidobacteriota bacterium]|nr:MAG: M20/M25/M40 family metallo-hydrolase [Acidobacteriota bacterium]